MISTFTIDYVSIFSDNYIWIIINPEQHTAIAIDPGDAEPLINYLTTHQLKLESILITHHHTDHTNGINALKNTYPINVYGPSHIPGITHPVKAPEILTLPSLNIPITIMSIPGHTLDHIAYYLPGILFCGDTLFSAGCGRVFEGTIAQMIHSLQKITDLPPDTAVYCTHEYTLKNLEFALMVEPSNINIKKRLDQAIMLRAANLPTLPTSVKEELEINPFLRCHIQEIREEVEDHFGLKLQNPSDVFQYLREWKNHF